jgi:hypothetical protein
MKCFYKAVSKKASQTRLMIPSLHRLSSSTDPGQKRRRVRALSIEDVTGIRMLRLRKKAVALPQTAPALVMTVVSRNGENQEVKTELPLTLDRFTETKAVFSLLNPVKEVGVPITRVSSVQFAFMELYNPVSFDEVEIHYPSYQAGEPDEHPYRCITGEGQVDENWSVRVALTVDVVEHNEEVKSAVRDFHAEDEYDGALPGDVIEEVLGSVIEVSVEVSLR